MASESPRLLTLEGGRLAALGVAHPRAMARLRDLGAQRGQVQLRAGEIVSAWLLEERHEAAARALLASFWPPEGLPEHLFTFTSVGTRAVPTIDGVPLLTLWPARRRIGPLHHPDVTAVVRDTLTITGRAAWRVSGTLVVRARVRRDSLPPTWPGGEVEEATIPPPGGLREEAG